MRPTKHVPDSEPDKRGTGRWFAYGSLLPSLPEVGAVCGKAARTDLGGGREVTRVPTAKELVCCDCSQPLVALSCRSRMSAVTVSIGGRADVPQTLAASKVQVMIFPRPPAVGR